MTGGNVSINKIPVVQRREIIVSRLWQCSEACSETDRACSGCQVVFSCRELFDALPAMPSKVVMQEYFERLRKIKKGVKELICI